MTDTFLDYFSGIEDPRISGIVTYPLEELIFTTLCGVLCGANDWVVVSEYGKGNLAYLGQFLPYKNGAASHDTYWIQINSAIVFLNGQKVCCQK